MFRAKGFGSGVDPGVDSGDVTESPQLLAHGFRVLVAARVEFFEFGPLVEQPCGIGPSAGDFLLQFPVADQTPLLEVDYNRMLTDGTDLVHGINRFLDNQLDAEAMLQVIDRGLYRNRSKQTDDRCAAASV